LARKRTNAPTKPADARAHRSIEALQAAFLRLLETKPFDQILIKEITDSAGVSYPTFFRRFASKEDLLEHIAAEEVRNLLHLGQSAIAGGDPASAQVMCEYVHAHRTLWTTLLTGGAQAVVRNEFMRVARHLATTNPRRNPWLPLDLAVSFVTSGIFEIFAWWLQQPEDYPIQNVVTFLNVLIVDTTARRRNITLI
jgi:AcrR family transcriptional regulator